MAIVAQEPNPSLNVTGPAYELPPNRPIAGSRPPPQPPVKPPRASMRNAKQAVMRVQTRPELTHLCEHFDVVVDSTLKSPFQLRAGRQIALAPQVAALETAAAVALRHCAEIDLLRRLNDLPTGDQTELDIAVIALRVAALYMRAQPKELRQACEGILPSFLTELYVAGAQSVPFALAAEREQLCRVLPQLLPLGGQEPPTTAVKMAELDAALAALRTLGTIAGPTDYLLISDGDTRLDLDSLSRLNQYGCSPKPRAAINFSSTTASSISQKSFDEVEILRQQLLRDARMGFANEVERTELGVIKAKILALAGCAEGDGAEIIVAASGTDTLLTASQLAQSRAFAGGGDGQSPKLTILVPGIDETGSGIPQAAVLRHYNARTALGEPVDRDAGIDGSSFPLLSLTTVPVRRDDGMPLDADAIDAAVTHAAEATIAAGERVLLHLIDVSKTGLILPSVACVDRLARRFSGKLDVVVDACQLRLSPITLQAYLRRGWLVSLTGSKFLTGPAFAGALIVPPSWVTSLRNAAGLPIGFIAQSARQHWPDDWGHMCRQLTMRRQPGLLLRWRAALTENAQFEALSELKKRDRLSEFARGVEAQLSNAEYCTQLAAPPLDRAVLGQGQSWDLLPSIFTFTLHHLATGQALTMDDAKRVHRWLNSDLGNCFDAVDRDVASTICHVGQPVAAGRRDGQVIGALRIAASVRSLVKENVEEPLAQVAIVLKKTSLIIRHLDRLRGEADRLAR